MWYTTAEEISENYVKRYLSTRHNPDSKAVTLLQETLKSHPAEEERSGISCVPHTTPTPQFYLASTIRRQAGPGMHAVPSHLLSPSQPAACPVPAVLVSQLSWLPSSFHFYY